MPENAKDSVYEKENLERNVAEAFAPIWELGVLGVKMTLSPTTIKMKVYLLSEVADGILDPAIVQVESSFDGGRPFEKQIVHGIVPAAKIVTSYVD